MYIPAHFAQPNVEAMQALMRAHPLATLATLTPHGIDANHLPLHLMLDGSPHGVLRGHVARSNPVWQELSPDHEVLAIFRGPDAYISPSWYPTKRETGRVVPTWNYAVVHAHGALRVIDDPAWLRSQITALTAQQEIAMPHPWAVSEAPAEYIDAMVRGIVGIEITVTRLEGKFKLSQNQPQVNRDGVIEGLQAQGGDAAQAMAALVEQQGTAVPKSG